MGRPLTLEYVKYGVLGWYGLGTGIAPLRHPPDTPPRVHPLHHGHHTTAARVQSRGLKEAVGLRSVEQLTLSAHISGFTGITEVYNLV